MVRGLLLLGICALLTGCAAVAPLTSLISSPQSGPPPLQVHEETRVSLAQDDFVLVKTNVVGHSSGFSLLGLITIVPATLTKAMNRLYASAQMQTGRPQTVAHLVIEQTSTYWILFGIPRIEVRADIVEFNAGTKAGPVTDVSNARAGPVAQKSNSGPWETRRPLRAQQSEQ